jgi:hypothetical protein
MRYAEWNAENGSHVILTLSKCLAIMPP